jgi:glycerol uptake facilitator-like aquaporin
MGLWPSGAHMNPAVSFAMAGFGVFSRAFVAPHIVAQLLGSVVGVFAARLAWGPVIATRPVEFAVLQPGAGWTDCRLVFIRSALSAYVPDVLPHRFREKVPEFALV